MRNPDCRHGAACHQWRIARAHALPAFAARREKSQPAQRPRERPAPSSGLPRRNGNRHPTITMEIQRTREDDAFLLTLTGRLDATWADPVEAALEAAVRAGEHR